MTTMRIQEPRVWNVFRIDLGMIADQIKCVCSMVLRFIINLVDYIEKDKCYKEEEGKGN